MSVYCPQTYSKTAIVDLHQQTTLLLLGRHLLGEAESIVQVQDEVHIVTEVLEGRVVAGTSAPHVVLPGVVAAAAALVPQLQQADDENDLPARGAGQGIPLRLGAEVRAREGIAGEGVRPGEDEVGLDAVSDERGHGDAAVLDLRKHWNERQGV